MNLFTKNGKPLQVVGDKVYSKSGAVVGRIKGSEAYGPNGRYVGSIVGDRLVYRSTQNSMISSPFTSARRVGIAQANAVASAVWGDEPNIPD